MVNITPIRIEFGPTIHKGRWVWQSSIVVPQKDHVICYFISFQSFCSTSSIGSTFQLSKLFILWSLMMNKPCFSTSLVKIQVAIVACKQAMKASGLHLVTAKLGSWNHSIGNITGSISQPLHNMVSSKQLELDCQKVDLTCTASLQSKSFNWYWIVPHKKFR